MDRAVMERVYRFGSFTLDEPARELRRDGNLVAMPPKALLTLLALVQAEGRVIPKAELLRTVWPDTYVAGIFCDIESGSLTFVARRPPATQPL